jgi:hypothetical protein
MSFESPRPQRRFTDDELAEYQASERFIRAFDAAYYSDAADEGQWLEKSDRFVVMEYEVSMEQIAGPAPEQNGLDKIL